MTDPLIYVNDGPSHLRHYVNTLTTNEPLKPCGCGRVV